MIPFYKAIDLDTNQEVVGYLKPAWKIGSDLKEWVIFDADTNIHNISVDSLCITFDGGKSFIKLSDLEIHTCTDFKLEYTNMQMNNRKDVQPPNGSIFTIITDKGR